MYRDEVESRSVWPEARGEQTAEVLGSDDEWLKDLLDVRPVRVLALFGNRAFHDE